VKIRTFRLSDCVTGGELGVNVVNNTNHFLPTFLTKWAQWAAESSKAFGQFLPIANVWRVVATLVATKLYLFLPGSVSYFCNWRRRANVIFR
jgi:hypothetical protein